MVSRSSAVIYHDGLTLTTVQGNIEFRNVYFSYLSRIEIPILSGFYLTVPAKKAVALGGRNGSGKSSIIPLLEQSKGWSSVDQTKYTAGGQLITSRFELNDVRSLLPTENEADDLHDHIIICGFGRIGQIIAQLLSGWLSPFVAFDLQSDQVAPGRSMELPVYFGDAGSQEVLHRVGAESACAVAVALDNPGANYRPVWALSKHSPNLKTIVHAHDVNNGVNFEPAMVPGLADLRTSQFEGGSNVRK